MALKFSDAVCCNGNLCKEYTASLGFPPERMTTGHMAADTEALGVQRKQVDANAIESLRKSWDAKGVVFLSVGQLITRKGISNLLDGWQQFERKYPGQGALIIVGAGPEEKSLKEQATRQGLSEVRFVGAIDYDRLAPYYAAADAFIISTLEDNWSLVVPEAMACGLPILCSKYNGCWPELVHEGRNGWIFDPLAVSDILRSLEACLSNRKNLSTMGENSRQILQDHTPQKAAAAIFESCQIALHHRNGPGK